MTAETVTSAILRKMSGIGKCQVRFLVHVIKLFLQLRGRYNFANMARYGGHVEQYYRKWYSRPFDFGEFNRLLVTGFGSGNLVIGVDPSYVPKSGKHTPGTGYFWSGCAQAMKWGIEICGISVIDLDNHTSFHYKAVQTIYDKAKQTLREYYAAVIAAEAENLKKISTVLVFDAFFSKKGFVDQICAMGFTLVSRLQHNAFLRYRYLGERTGRQGRPKTFDGKIDPKKVSTKHFKEISRTDDEVVYEGEAHVRSLDRWVRLVIVQTLKDGKVKSALLYFSTELGGRGCALAQAPIAGQAETWMAQEAAGSRLVKWYRGRFLMEFGFRDTKQHLGLTHCQSRNKEALGFHFNISLTALNIAKVVHWLPAEKHERPPFSMADIKTQYTNEILLDRIISIYGKDPNVEKNNPLIRQLYELGKIAA